LQDKPAFFVHTLNLDVAGGGSLRVLTRRSGVADFDSIRFAEELGAADATINLAILTGPDRRSALAFGQFLGEDLLFFPVLWIHRPKFTMVQSHRSVDDVVVTDSRIDDVALAPIV